MTVPDLARGARNHRKENLHGDVLMQISIFLRRCKIRDTPIVLLQQHSQIAPKDRFNMQSLCIVHQPPQILVPSSCVVSKCITDGLHFHSVSAAEHITNRAFWIIDRNSISEWSLCLREAKVIKLLFDGIHHDSFLMQPMRIIASFHRNGVGKRLPIRQAMQEQCCVVGKITCGQRNCSRRIPSFQASGDK